MRPHAVSQPHLDLEKPTAWHATRSIHRYDDGYGGKTEAYDIKYFDLNTSNMTEFCVLYNQCIFDSRNEIKLRKNVVYVNVDTNLGIKYCD